MGSIIYGYARVSSKDQNLDRQVDALLAFPVEGRRIYADKASGKDFDRPRYKALVRRLRSEPHP
ncbi:recombinase family protein [Adlercreutzia sp. ZJ473]|uniref:recombinase family protein n=1 Tax=Adlercreutzia sp. ZJ473 TaxID=2722822 RepID=UPI001554AA3C|nr:recombinase family protein [Adlercreutzia sp. ZJ473]